ncbi:MAG: cadmium-translocating P-type ATPase [Planctomycetes bacterium]|nr:cadmium-translocating P-type ATPase [Planctomycetota bacterium]
MSVHAHDHAADAADEEGGLDGLLVPVAAGACLAAAWCMQRGWLSGPWEAQRLLFVAAYLIAGSGAFVRGLRLAVRLHLDVDFLMVVAAIGAAWIGRWVDGGLLLFLFSLGNALEHYAMGQARKAIRALGQLAPRVARRRTDTGDEEVPVERLAPGDTILVRPGERMPADGRVHAGAGAVDQSPITGESVPVEKAPGDEVFAGTVNGDGSLEISVTRRAQDSTMARMIRLVEEAQHQKGRTQRVAERFTAIYVPCVVAGTLAALALPPLLGWLPFDESLLRAIAMLVGASPCALAISTPAAVLAGVARAARSGVLIKGGLHLESLAEIRAIAMDKTGTITAGRPTVAAVVPAPGVEPARLLSLAAALERRSEHPIAHAIVTAAEGAPRLDASDVTAIRGKGLRGTLEGRPLEAGSPRLLAELATEVPAEVRARIEALDREGHTIVAVIHGGALQGALALSDRPRTEASRAIDRLHRLGVRPVIMLTGDRRAVADQVARSVGVDEVQAELLPEDKIEHVRSLLQRHGAIAMVGDGVNDAPALAMATVGVAMGRGGTDVALEAADVALMADDLERIPFAVALARFARSVIRQNVLVSMGMVLLLIPLTLAGLVNTTLAVIMHEGSTVAVVINGLRLLAWRDRTQA